MIEFKCISIFLYLIFALMSWFIFVFWLHNEKPELNYGWILSIIVGATLAIVWPFSLVAMHFNNILCNNEHESTTAY